MDHPKVACKNILASKFDVTQLPRQVTHVNLRMHTHTLHVNVCTLPKTNSLHLKIGHPKRKRSYSNHPFSGAMLVSGRIKRRKIKITRDPPTKKKQEFLVVTVAGRGCTPNTSLT